MQSRTIAVIGGTGKEGSGLALRWAHAGHRVLIGSRAAERAREMAAAINGRVGAERAEGSDNLAAAQGAEIAVLTVPYAAQLETLGSIKAALAGKVLIDVTVPLVPPQVSRVQLPDGGSAVLRAQKLLGDGVRVVSAFQKFPPSISVCRPRHRLRRAGLRRRQGRACAKRSRSPGTPGCARFTAARLLIRRRPRRSHRR